MSSILYRLHRSKAFPGSFGMSVDEKELLSAIHAAVTLAAGLAWGVGRSVLTAEELCWWAHPVVYQGLMAYREDSIGILEPMGKSGWRLRGVQLTPMPAGVPGLQLRGEGCRHVPDRGLMCLPVAITVLNEEAWPLSDFVVVTPRMREQENADEP